MAERSNTPESWEERYEPSAETCNPLDTKFFLLVKIIFDIMCPCLRSYFISLWNSQKVKEYGPWEVGRSKLAEAIGSYKHFKMLAQPIKKKICSADIDNFDPTCLFNVVLHLNLFTLNRKDRQALDNLEYVRHQILHSSCTQMTEPDFNEHNTSIKEAFITLNWDTNELEKLSEAKWCVTDEEYVRLRKIHAKEKDQWLLESRNLETRLVSVERALEEIKVQSSQELKDWDNGAVMQGNIQRNERSGSDTIKLCENKQVQTSQRPMSPRSVTENHNPISSQSKDQNEMSARMLHEMANQRKDHDHMVTTVIDAMVNQTKEHGDMVKVMVNEMANQRKEQSKQSEIWAHQQQESGKMVEKMVNEMASQRKEHSRQTEIWANQQKESGKMMEKMVNEMASQRNEQRAVSTKGLNEVTKQRQQIIAMANNTDRWQSKSLIPQQVNIEFNNLSKEEDFRISDIDKNAYDWVDNDDIFTPIKHMDAKYEMLSFQKDDMILQGEEKGDNS